MLMCMHAFLAEGRACLRTHEPGQCEWSLSCRSARQSYRALGLMQCIRSGLVCYLFSTKNKKKVHQPFHPRSALQRPNFQGHGTTRNTALKIETW